jgi:hypothetical protein
MVTVERGNKNKLAENSNLKTVTGERANKKPSWKLLPKKGHRRKAEEGNVAIKKKQAQNRKSMVIDYVIGKQPLRTTICPHNMTSVWKPRHLLHSPQTLFVLRNNVNDMRHHFNTRIGQSNARTPQMLNGTQVQDATFPLKPQLGSRMQVVVFQLHCGCFIEKAETWVNGTRKTRS